MSADEADRLAADGVQVKLLDGRELSLKFDFKALRKIEKTYGGLRALFEAIGDPLGPKFYDGILVGLLAGLWRQPNITEDVLEEELDPTEMFSYMEALNNALMEAFPRQAREAMEAARQTTSPSPGNVGTTSQPSDTEELTTSSGQ